MKKNVTKVQFNYEGTCNLPRLTTAQILALLPKHVESKSLEEIRSIINKNRNEGKETYSGLDSSEIGKYNGSLMFGENGEAYPGDEVWSRIVD